MRKRDIEESDVEYTSKLKAELDSQYAAYKKGQTKMNRHFFQHAIDGNTKINGTFALGVAPLLFEVKKQTKTLRDHKQLLFNSE